MNAKAEISVIVPCFNAERYLSTCLESLKAQKEPALEMIFIDDGSTDATGAILDAFARTEPRASVLHIHNSGVSAARNRGITMASGRYIAFVDADDALEENGFALLYQAAVRSGAQITSANHTLFDMEKNRRVPVQIEPVLQQPLEIVREIIHMHRIYNNLWNKLYERELFEDGLRLDEGVRIGEDALLNLQLYLRARRVMHIPEHTYVYRVHARSAMANIGRYSEAHQPMLAGMNAILLRQGVKELYFRDFLQSCVWVDEKESGIRACMGRFNAQIRPLVLDGVDASRIPRKDARLYRAVTAGRFPRLYMLLRIREKITGRKWGIRR
ncbi:MAG TPA: glycosyltransferase [Candidatus Ventricola intestinavium]|nr:glycosyltransferase [Candidatus Ventricola intestinavium]